MLRSNFCQSVKPAPANHDLSPRFGKAQRKVCPSARPATRHQNTLALHTRATSTALVNKRTA